MIEIKYFAHLSEQLGIKSENIPFDSLVVPTTAGLFNHLQQRGEQWAALLDKRVINIALNQELIRNNHRIQPGDEVALFPPVTGG
jgi:molybdopterin synthase sulfur carrier subunit